MTTFYNVRMDVETNISASDDDVFPTMELVEAWISRKEEAVKANPDYYGDLNTVFFVIEEMEDGKLVRVINL